jgi:hypothetical protein
MADVMVHIDTEEDIDDASCLDLPTRQEVERRLKKYFAHIPEARQIEQTTLHYLKGRIDIELLLPLTAVADATAAPDLARRFAEASQADQDIGRVELKFH